MHTGIKKKKKQCLSRLFNEGLKGRFLYIRDCFPNYCIDQGHLETAGNLIK